jgi:poly(hydroxyalkanoate) granule-associated protein
MTKAKTSPIDDLRTTTRKIWLAGLGALAEAEKAGDELFQTLVKSGEKFEHVLKEPVDKATGAVKESMKGATTRASSTLRELETALDRQVAAAMKRAGLASRDELDALKKEMARLRKTVAAPKSAGKSRTAKKTSRKKTSRARHG